jgi:hypothetical protein
MLKIKIFLPLYESTKSRNALRDFRNESRSIYYLDTSIWNCEKLAAEQALPESTE